MKFNLIEAFKGFFFMGAIIVSTQNVFAQERLATNKISTEKSMLKNAGMSTSLVVKDTVECMFHQLVNNNRPLLTWRKGYIVLENKQIRLGDNYYQTSQASSLTGLIQNQFLASDKRKPIKKKVVQVVLLQ